MIAPLEAAIREAIAESLDAVGAVLAPDQVDIVTEDTAVAVRDWLLETGKVRDR